MQVFFEVSEGVQCLVGWDVPMETFFGQVYRVDGEGEPVDDEFIHRVGTKKDGIRTVDHLQQLLSPHATIPPNIRRQLFEIEID